VVGGLPICLSIPVEITEMAAPVSTSASTLP
jgi:hypothetical protein